MIKILELFGGVGAPRKSLINLGVQHKSIDYVEWNPKSVRTYNSMFDNRYAPQSVIGYDLKPDILIHGSPCQDFSVAGKQYGGNVADGTRSSLMFETIKIIRNLGIWKPRVVIWENVTNVLSKNMKSAFNHYLDDMRALGYTNSYDVLNAMDFGIPQDRKRIFVVSTLDTQHFNFFKLENKPMRPIGDFLENDVDDKYTITQPSMVKRIHSDCAETGYKRQFTVITDYCQTITTRQTRCPNSGIVKLEGDRYRVLTERECWRLMGFDDTDFDNAEREHPGIAGKMNATLYHQAGNSMVVDVLEAIFKQILEAEK